MTEDIEEQRILFETAVLAKLKGFKEKCDAWFWFDTENRCPEKNGQLFIQTHRNRDNTPIGVSAPRQTLLAKWLREVHNIDIQITLVKAGYKEYRVEIYKQPENTNEYTYFFIKEDNYIKTFNKYEDALEEGLFHALKLI